MTSGELIERLQKLDPEGNTPVCIGNENIWFVHIESAYWDGKLETLTWDKDKVPIQGSRTSIGDKIQIRPIGLHDCYEYTEHNGFHITYETERDRETYEAGDLAALREHNDTMEEIRSERAKPSSMRSSLPQDAIQESPYSSRLFSDEEKQ